MRQEPPENIFQKKNIPYRNLIKAEAKQQGKNFFCRHRGNVARSVAQIFVFILRNARCFHSVSKRFDKLLCQQSAEGFFVTIVGRFAHRAQLRVHYFEGFVERDNFLNGMELSDGAVDVMQHRFCVSVREHKSGI